MFPLHGEGLLAPDIVMGGGAEDDTRAMFAFLDQDGDGFVDPQDWVDGLCGVDSNTELAGMWRVESNTLPLWRIHEHGTCRCHPSPPAPLRARPAPLLSVHVHARASICDGPVRTKNLSSS